MQNMQSVMNAHFTKVPGAEIPRSSFQRDFGYKTAINFDYLYPIFIEEAVPGDVMNIDFHAICRLATPINPLMDNTSIDTFFFSVPYRLVWDNFRAFMGEQENPTDTVDYLIPTITSPATTGHAEDSIYDFMDIPPNVPDMEHSALWNRAINLIWNEWFKDENIQDAVEVPKGDGPDDPALYTLLKRGKRHDYFTSCLPFAQKDYGNPVLLPLGTSAPITGIATSNQTFPDPSQSGWDTKGNNVTYTNSILVDGGVAVSKNFIIKGTAATGGLPDITADLSDASAATINQLRLAFQIQKMYERDARGGSRYVEIVKSHFGVTTPSAGWRSEYLGGGSTPIGINPVPQTSQAFGTATADTPQGNLAAYGVAQMRNNGFTKSFTEHCLVIGLCCAKSDLTYQQGLPRKYSRSTRFDHFFPALSHIGEQAVLQQEIFASGVPAEDQTVLGYQERWAEMRYSKSAITGAMRSSHSQTLDSWHLSQDFANAPTLSPEFIEQDTPIDRVLAVTTAEAPNLICDMYARFRHARPMPTYSTPGLIDHF